ncbi:hypothetical protein OGAPHI_003201 [Ogataea philodendri]|uniref:Uncharacterized protein n=1 Tax=Ogataea philodendri TaxID=1378263 RepID=A0A9P8P7H0_9ASCO|nr:uncharacterized protein OGAPHI_003201 [Ogataea philodendri]KAH3666752.1 hypothetical protein OGAPHI_003201 [Ogataea philodendri]
MITVWIQSEMKERRNEDVGGKHVAQEHPVANRAESGRETLGHGVCCWGTGFELQAYKHENCHLQGTGNAIEETSRDAVRVTPGTGGEQSSGPCPCRNGGRGNQAGIDTSGGGGEPFRVLDLAQVAGENTCDQAHEQGERCANAQHKAIAVALVKNRGGHGPHIGVGSHLYKAELFSDKQLIRKNNVQGKVHGFKIRWPDKERSTFVELRSKNYNGRRKTAVIVAAQTGGGLRLPPHWYIGSQFKV